MGEKESILTDAKNIIYGERQDQYGNPEDSFSIIAGYWNVFLKTKLKNHINPKDVDYELIMTFIESFNLGNADVANMMILMKQARKLGQKACRDNYVDSVGYEAIAADRIIDWKKKEDKFDEGDRKK